MGLPENSGIKLTNRYEKGPENLITDVPGVAVGHRTLEDDSRHIHTGVTAILPHRGNLFREKVTAGVAVINGFGKSAGLIQAKELGSIETPIIMTNTFSVGTAVNALTKYMLARNEDIGVTTCTVNSLVTECNDGELNDIRGMHVTEEDVFSALENAAESFEEGPVGAGTGMICMGLKGGIGSASRRLQLDDEVFTIGALVLSNFGEAGNLRIDGDRIKHVSGEAGDGDKGSVIILIGTDIPLESRQLERMAKRSAASLGRVGSFMGTGSGDIAIAFSTGNIIPHYPEKSFIRFRTVSENRMDRIFEATVETVEEAVISSLYHGRTVTGIRNRTAPGLQDMLRRQGKLL